MKFEGKPVKLTLHMTRKCWILLHFSCCCPSVHGKSTRQNPVKCTITTVSQRNHVGPNLKNWKIYKVWLFPSSRFVAFLKQCSSDLILLFYSSVSMCLLVEGGLHHCQLNWSVNYLLVILNPTLSQYCIAPSNNQRLVN